MSIIVIACSEIYFPSTYTKLLYPGQKHYKRWLDRTLWDRKQATIIDNTGLRSIVDRAANENAQLTTHRDVSCWVTNSQQYIYKKLPALLHTSTSLSSSLNYV